MTKFQVYRDTAGKFRFRLRAANNEIVAVSEAYEQHAGCLNGVKSVKKNRNSEIEDLTIGAKKLKNPKYRVFTDAASKFRFDLSAPNGEIIAVSEGYETKEGCLNGIQVVKRSGQAEIEDLTVAHAIKKEPAEKVMPTTLGEAEKKMPAPVSESEKVMPTTVGEVEEVMPAPIGEVEEVMPALVGKVGTELELETPQSAVKHEIVTFKGRMLRSDTGEGIPNAKILILEQDRHFFNDEWLAYGNTKEDGTFSINWKARRLDWWKNTGEIYAQFDGNEKAKPSKTNIHIITIK